jgi:hypothetical protein
VPHLLRKIKRRLAPARNASAPPRVDVTFIYAPSENFYESFRTHTLRFPLTRVPPRYLRGRAFRHFLPNNLLQSLNNQGAIRLRNHALEPSDRPYDGPDAKNIPRAEVWVFALLNDSSMPICRDAFFEAIHTRAQREGIRVINLASHSGTPPGFEPRRKEPLPALAKLKANGLTTPGDSDSFTLLETQADLTAWTERLDPARRADYEVQPHLEHRRDAELAPFRCIERWICLPGDLTVGLRFSEEMIIKQLNSLTYYIRDPRRLEHEYRLLHRITRDRRRLRKNGPEPLSFGYSGTSEFWDPRNALYQRLRDATGFEIGSMDVFEDSDGDLHLIDYNEWTFESARKDLFSLWEVALLDAIRSSPDGPK